MIEFIKKFSQIGLLVVGDIMLDQYVWGNVKRISPEAPVPVVEVTREDFRLGGAGNVVNNIASLGGTVHIASVAGKDDMGGLLRSHLRSSGISDKGIISETKRPTSVKTRIIAHNQQVVRIDREKTKEIGRNTSSRLLDFIEKTMPKTQGIIISDYAKGVITNELIRNIVAMAGTSHLIAVDPKIGHFSYYHNVDVITPNLNEASQGANIEITDSKSLVKAGNTLLEHLKCKAVLITRGEEGMSLFQSNSNVIHIPTCAKHVYDVTGAGDTVISTFVLARCTGAGVKDASVIANHAAGIVVGEVGTATLTSEELIENIGSEKHDKTC